MAKRMHTTTQPVEKRLIVSASRSMGGPMPPAFRCGVHNRRKHRSEVSRLAIREQMN